MTCSICNRKLNDLRDLLSKDCGGDCLRCMAEIAEDPDCIKAVCDLVDRRVVREAWMIAADDDGNHCEIGSTMQSAWIKVSRALRTQTRDLKRMGYKVVPVIILRRDKRK